MMRWGNVVPQRSNLLLGVAVLMHVNCFDNLREFTLSPGCAAFDRVRDLLPSPTERTQ